MHSRERREFGRRKMKIKNKWEVVLVLIIIAAGIVITTVAAVKAKERRRLQADNTTDNNTSKSSVSHVREAVNNSSNESVTKDHNRKRVLPLDTLIKRHKSDDSSQPDYDVEYDLVKAGADEYTAMASESIDQIPRNRIRVPHDGLPGFPPPFGVSNDFNSNVELSADAAGFLLESGLPLEDFGKQMVDTKDDLISKPSTHVRSEVKANTNKMKTSIKITNTNNHNNGAKSEPKQRIPVFADPPKEVSESKLKAVQSKAPEPKQDMKIAIPVKIVSRIPVRNEQMPNISPENSGALRITLPALDPTIRFLGLSDDFHHSIDYGSAQVGSGPIQAAPGVVGNIPLHMRRFLSPEMGNKDNMHSINMNPKIRSKRASERSFALKQVKPKSSYLSGDDSKDDSEPKTGESRYIPFSERSFMSDDDRDDSDSDDEDNGRPLFNFDDLENRFPSVVSSTPRDSKHKDEPYSSEESRHKQKYGILGSGNFEIIRGGIYGDDESATNNVANYANDNNDGNDNNMQNFDNSNSDNNENRKVDHQVMAYTPNDEQINDDDDRESNQFGPFNLDFFNGSPVLGFQGYDNFGAATLDPKTPVPVRKPIKRVSQRGQRRHYFDSFPADSNLHVITSDKDLYSDS